MTEENTAAFIRAQVEARLRREIETAKTRIRLSVADAQEADSRADRLDGLLEFMLELGAFMEQRNATKKLRAN